MSTTSSSKKQTEKKKKVYQLNYISLPVIISKAEVYNSTLGALPAELSKSVWFSPIPPTLLV